MQGMDVPFELVEVEQIPWHKDSETYDPISRQAQRHLAEGSVIREDNPLHIGGIELLDEYRFTGFRVPKDVTESDWFRHHYGSDSLTELEEIGKYFVGLLEEERNFAPGDTSKYNWWVVVQGKSSSYDVRVYISSKTEENPVN